MLDVVRSLAANKDIPLRVPETVDASDWPKRADETIDVIHAHAGYMRRYGDAAYLAVGIPFEKIPVITPDHIELADTVAQSMLPRAEIARQLWVSIQQLTAWLLVAKGDIPPRRSLGRTPIPPGVMQRAAKLTDAMPGPGFDPTIASVVANFHATGMARTEFADHIGVNRSTFAAWLAIANGEPVPDTDRANTKPSRTHLERAEILVTIRSAKS